MAKKEILVTRSSMPPFEEYVQMIKPLWDSHWLTNMGMYHRELEQQLQDYLGVNYVSLTVNGHMALELAIQSMNFPAGSEVITTPFTFVSTTHAILRNNLVPVFCDIKDDFTINEEKIEELITEKTVAIVPVHVYGNICNVEKIQEIAYKYDLRVIYDAAHAFGECYKGKGIGSFGDVSVFSFHATKVFQTIEGGAVCSKDKYIYEKMYNLKNFGIRSEELVVSVGANAKMNEFQAAMGICNLKYIEHEINKRREIVTLYRELLEDNDKVTMNGIQENVTKNNGYFPVLFQSEAVRNLVYNELLSEGVHARKYFYPLTSDEVCFKNKYKGINLDNARNYSKRILVLPLFSGMEKEDVVWIVQKIKAILETEGE